MKSILLGGIAVLVAFAAQPALAQTRQQPARPAPAAPAQPALAPPPANAAQAPAQPEIPPQNQARVTGWVARCVGSARAAAPDCVAEQDMTLITTNQTVMAVVVRIAPDTRAPTIQIQLPHGTWLPGGVKLRTDTGVGLDLAFQMCDARGCFTGNPVTPELLTALKSAKQLIATVQNMARQAQVITMPMDGFAAAYEKIQ